MMSARTMADLVVVLHFAFVLFVVTGGLLAVRWPKLLWIHVPVVLYSLWIVVFSITCPLTPIERDLRERAGQERYEESFVERYVEGVLYPGDMLLQAQLAAASVVIAGWVAVAIRTRARRRAQPSG